MKSEHFYSDEKSIQIIVALLKAHGIRQIVASPGTSNIGFVGSVQSDPWFRVYSAVDERHAAYLAVGMAQESGEPVVLNCTAATASRNYFPALTEAYYRKLPILAITMIHRLGNLGNLLPQMIDRSVHPNDTVRYSVEVRSPHSPIEEDDCALSVNKAILELTRDGGGPVHINLETSKVTTFTTKELPPVRVIKRIKQEGVWPDLGKDQRIAIWIGSHKKFTPQAMAAIERFVAQFNAIVFVDHTSSYAGKGRVNSALLAGQMGIRNNSKYAHLMPTLQIQLGEVTGDYFTMAVADAAPVIWRVNEDGEIRDLTRKLAYVFAMPEESFFGHYAESSLVHGDSEYYKAWMKADAELRLKIPDFPFSNLWMASHAHDRFPKNSVVHFGIYNSLRSWIQFPLPDGVESASNVGGFGIDGALSTCIGASLVHPGKLYFCVTGDLAFFYDLNALGNRHVGKNLRILLVNNGCGSEFKLSINYGSQFGDRTDDYIAAGHHFGDKSPDLVRHFTTDLGLDYMTASNKDEFLSGLERFFDPKQSRSIVFECFTTPKGESDALEMLSRIDPLVDAKSLAKTALKNVLPRSAIDSLRKIIK